MDSTLSFAEQAHRAIADAPTPTDALNRMLPLFERTIASAGTLLYQLAPNGTLTGLAGALGEAFRRESWFLADDPCRRPEHHERGPNIMYATRLVDRRRHERSVAFREFYGPRDIAHVACVALGKSSRDATKLGLFLGRNETSGDFSPADETILAMSLPLLTSLCRARLAWTEIEQPSPVDSGLARYGLTPTEARVLECLGAGASNHEIAASLDIKPSTAATHVKRVLSKLGVSSRLKAGLLMQRLSLGTSS